MKRIKTAGGDIYMADEVDAQVAEAVAVGIEQGIAHQETRIGMLKKSHERYEKLRRLSPREFHSLWMQSIAGDRFDDVVDRLPD